MALRETLELDLSRAQAQLDEFEALLDSLLRPAEIPLTVNRQAITDLGEVDDRLRTIEAAAQSLSGEFDRVETSLRGIPDDADNLARSLDRAEDEAGRLSNSLEAATRETRQAEGEADELARGLDRAADDADRLADETTRAGREIDQASRRGVSGLRRLGTAFGLVTAAAAALGAARFVDFARDSIGAASDLAESASKAEVVFGGFSKTVFDFTERAPQALGLSTQAALEFTGTFGNLFTALGLSQQAAADLSPEIVQLGADLASFNNLEVGDALEKLRAGLVGEVEPLRALGVSFNAADVERKAFELGLATVGGVVSEAAKVQARYALILEQTGNAQGDFARTADGIANSQRTVQAQFENLRAEIGQNLLPAYQALLDIAPQVIQAADQMGPPLAAAAQSIADFLEGLSDDEGVTLPEIFTSIPSGIGTVIDAFKIGGDAVQAFIGLLNFKDVAREVDDMGDKLDNVFTRIARQTIAADLGAGEDAVTAFANAVAFLGRQDALGSVDLLEKSFESLRRQAGLTGPQLAQATRFLLDNAEKADLSAAEIAFLTQKLKDLSIELGRTERQEFAKDFTRGAKDAGDEIVTVNDQLAILRSTADTAGISVADLVDSGDGLPEFASALAGIPPAVQEFAATQNVITDFVDAFNTSARNLADSVDVFSEVPDALKTTKAEFLANLEITAAEQARFEANLARLFLIAPTLATTLQQQGITARGLVVDFLDDATAAQNAEAVLRGNAVEVTGAYTAALIDSLGQAGLDRAGIEALLRFAEGFSDPSTIAAVVAGFRATLADQLSQIAGFTVPVQLVALPGIQGGLGGAGGAANVVRQVDSGTTTPVTVNINNLTTTDPATTTSQIAQAGAAIGSLLR